MSTKHKSQLDKLKDEVKTCTLESKRPNQEDNPMTRQIRILENRLDKAMIKYNEAQSIKTTYEQIVKRLKDHRYLFENVSFEFETNNFCNNHFLMAKRVVAANDNSNLGSPVLVRRSLLRI